MIDLRPFDTLGGADHGWLRARHHFSFSGYQDPTRMNWGAHPHQDMEIVTWVLDGGLVHQDSEGHSGVIHPGLAQRMSAGTGILHSEKNDSWRITGGDTHTDPVHFVQMWVVPDTGRIQPGYEQLDITAELEAGGLVTVASGMDKHAGDRAIRIQNRYAGLLAARMRDGEAVQLPEAPFVHLFVARGAVELEGAGALETGDAARITVSDGRRVAAVGGPAEVLVWEMHATLG